MSPFSPRRVDSFTTSERQRFLCRKRQRKNNVLRRTEWNAHGRLLLIAALSVRSVHLCEERQSTYRGGCKEMTSQLCLFRRLCCCCRAPPPDLDTGDLILFDRPCLKMGGFFGAAICAAAKLMSGSPFDHIGVVVKDENGLNTMVEASFSGVAVRPLSERVRRSSASQICVRRLQVDRTEEMRAEARRFVSEVVHLPYKEGGDGLLQMVSAAFRFHPAKEQRRRVHAETIALSTAIASLEDELAAQPETARDDAVQATKKKRLQRAITRRRKALVFLASAAGGSPAAEAAAASAGPPPSSGAQATAEPPPRKASPSADNSTSSGSSSSGSGKGSTSLPSDLSSIASPSPPPSSSSPSPSPLSDSSPSSTAPAPPPPTEYDSGLFCSELVAALYQRLGLLDAPFPASHDYVPADFATSLGNPIDRVGFDHDGGAVSTAEGQNSKKEATTASAVDDNTASTAQEDERRRRSAAAGETHANPAVLAPPQPLPPVPEGDGRVALLGGASLGPGCWLRGGPPPRPSSPPPPPPSPDGGSATGNGPHGGGGGGGGNGGTELTPPAAAAYIAEGPIEKASPSGSPWPNQQVAGASAAAAAAGVLEVVWRLSDEMLVLPLSSSESLPAYSPEQRRPWRRRITADTWWGWGLSPKRLDDGGGPPAEAGVGAGAEACCLVSGGGGGGDCSPPSYCPMLHHSCLRRQTPPPPELTRLGSESSFEPRAGVWRDCLPPPLLQADRHRSCLLETRRAEGLAFGAEGHMVAWPPAAAAVEASRKARTDADARDGSRGDGDRSEKESSTFSSRVAIVTGFAAVAGAAFLAGSRATKPVPVGRRPRLGGSGGGSFAVSTTLAAAAAAAAAATAAVATSSSSGRAGGHAFPRREAGVA
ncbi:unnamed protein product [Scytosiphon promiscuus]